MKSAILATLAVLSLSVPTLAQEPNSCTHVLKLAADLGCFNISAPEKDAESKHFVISSKFGPTDCKVKANAKDDLRSHKNSCTSWLKERRSDLKANYLTGTCNESCEPCASSMERCSVEGIVHYIVK